MLPDVAGDSVPGDTTNPGAYFLNRSHQRPREQHDPSHAVAKLRADLGIGRDPAWIVIGGTGDQAGSEKGKEAASRRPTRPMMRYPRGEQTDMPVSLPGELNARAHVGTSNTCSGRIKVRSDRERASNLVQAPSVKA